MFYILLVDFSTLLKARHAELNHELITFNNFVQILLQLLLCSSPHHYCVEAMELVCTCLKPVNNF